MQRSVQNAQLYQQRAVLEEVQEDVDMGGMMEECDFDDGEADDSPVFKSS